jgi:hypothetical protein
MPGGAPSTPEAGPCDIRAMRSWVCRGFVSLLLPLAGLAACGDNAEPSAPDGGAAPDAMAAPDAPFAVGDHPAPPQIMSGGGPVATAPKIVPIFFTSADDDPFQPEVETFLAELASGDYSYWSEATAEYGVGPLTIEPTVVSTDPTPAGDGAMQTYLATMTDGTHAGWPEADGNTIYAVYLPPGLVFTDPQGQCTSWGGYHDELTNTKGDPLVYAIMPRCGGDILDNLTVVTSHELVEAATDPLPFSDPAYVVADDDHFVWGMTPGGELGDMCEYVQEASQRIVGLYMVQRTWSNASAAAGHDPCVPVTDHAYLGAAPVLDEDIAVMLHGGSLMTKGVAIPTGTSKDVEVDLWSDGPASDWSVTAYDVSSWLRGRPAELTFAWDQQTGHNGDKLTLTITRAADGRFGSGSEFVIFATNGTRTASQWWGFASN